jgi:8-oxo-dGTP diphosphatase
MRSIKTYNQFNSSDWFGPVQILDIKGNEVTTRSGTFINHSPNKITKGHTYILRIEDNKIIDTGMSCVDLLILVDTGKNYKILSILRNKEPFKGQWANPGGNVDEGEDPLDAAIRELEEETSLKIPAKYFNFIDVFNEPWRDPRNKNCISYAFSVLLNEIPDTMAADDADECTWNDVSYSGDINVDMAFDHKEVIKTTIKKMRKYKL